MVCIERGERRSATADVLLMPTQASRLCLFLPRSYPCLPVLLARSGGGGVWVSTTRGAGFDRAVLRVLSCSTSASGAGPGGADASRATPGTRRRGPSPPRGLSPGESAPQAKGRRHHVSVDHRVGEISAWSVSIIAASSTVRSSPLASSTRISSRGPAPPRSMNPAMVTGSPASIAWSPLRHLCSDCLINSRIFQHRIRRALY